MAPFDLLDQSEEDSLHAPRLLNFEEKLFRRLAKRLLAPAASINPPSTSPDGESGATSENEDEGTNRIKEIQQWREDALLDFAAFESHIVRVQFLLNSNERERQRYAEEKLRISDTAQAVRDNNAELHEQLKEAQGTLALRKQYDQQALQITNNPDLKPRDEQRIQLDKLNAEIAELERESREYSSTWAERRDQFGKIVDEGMQMLRLIRAEKEEAEWKEGMEGIVEGEEGEQSAARSSVGTPKAPTPSHVSQSGDQEDSGEKDHLSVPQISARDSRAGTPSTDQQTRQSAGADEDAPMIDDLAVKAADDNDSKGEDEGLVSEDEEDAADSMEIT